MRKTERLFRELRERRLVALLTPESEEQCVAAWELLQDEGIVLEIALRSGLALAGLRALLAQHPDALVLAGTVLTARQAEDALAAGAAGIVSADYVPEVVDVAVEHDVMCVPGGLADAGKQLAHKAVGYGCTLDELKDRYPYQWIYKLFPVFAGQTCHLDLSRAWRGPYRDLTVLYTGGVTLERLPRLATADPDGIFCASALSAHLARPDRARADLGRWKAALAPAPAPVFRPAAAPAPRVVTFGELMARLSPPRGERLTHAHGFDLHFGGAEANVAVSLARWGFRSSFVSALPPNELADNALSILRGHGVDTSNIIRQGPRMGVYWLEHGAGPRPSKVVYDRFPSALSELRPEALDWEAIFEDAHWFHWTGITPALGDNVAAALELALEAAKRKGLTVSADLNYRKKLWSREKAAEVLSGLMPHVDILMANEEDPASVFGLESPGSDLDSGRLDAKGYEQVAAELIRRFGFKQVAITLRQSLSASENRWSACLHDGRSFLQGPLHQIQIVDRVGAGDAFAAGLIHAILTGRSGPEALGFAIAASCLKHSIAGDFNLVSIREVEGLAAGKTGGRVER